jgi:hypothetical protein
MSVGEEAKTRQGAGRSRREGGTLLTGHQGHQEPKTRAQELIRRTEEPSRHDHLEQGRHPHDQRRHPGHRRGDLQATGGGHAHAGVPEAGRQLAGPALPGDELGTSATETESDERSSGFVQDLDRAVEFDQSQAFKKPYENDRHARRRALRGAVIGDYEMTNHPEDIDPLTKMSNVAAARSACSSPPRLLPVRFQFTDLPPRDLEKDLRHDRIHEVGNRTATRDSRSAVLTMPWVLLAAPHCSQTAGRGVRFEEAPLDRPGQRCRWSTNVIADERVHDRRLG